MKFIINNNSRMSKQEFDLISNQNLIADAATLHEDRER